MGRRDVREVLSRYVSKRRVFGVLSRKGAALDDVDLSVSFETMRMPELSSKARTWCSLVSVMELGCLIKERGISMFWLVALVNLNGASIKNYNRDLPGGI